MIQTKYGFLKNDQLRLCATETTVSLAGTRTVKLWDKMPARFDGFHSAFPLTHIIIWPHA